MDPKFSPPTPPLEFSNRFTLKGSWPPVSPDSKGEYVFAESDSGEGEFIVFRLDFWEGAGREGTWDQCLTEKKANPTPSPTPTLPISPK